jgi:hypothetical protein
MRLGQAISGGAQSHTQLTGEGVWSVRKSPLGHKIKLLTSTYP